VAVIERIGGRNARPYLIARGRLTEEDEERLLARVDTPPFVEVTIDLREVGEVTDEGCDALKSVADHLGTRGQTMVVLYLPDRDATKALERTGLVDDDRIVFIDSAVE
jgi:hypothetical protein